MKKVLLILLYCVAAQAQGKREIDALNQVGYSVKIAQPERYEKLYRQNAAQARKIHYTLGEAESESNLSLVYYFLGKYDEDVAHSLKAIALFSKIGNLEALAAQYGETGYRMKRRNMPKAQYYMFKGKQLAEQHHFTKPLLAIYNNYGVLKEMQQQLDSAMFYYEKSLSLQQKVKDSIGIPYSLNNIAGIQLMRKQYDEAAKTFTTALAIRERNKDQVGIAETLFAFGELEAARKQYEKSNAYFQKVLKIATQAGYLDLIRNSYKMLSENQEKQGDKETAFASYKLYTKYKDSILNKATNSRIAELEVAFDTGQKEKQLAESRTQLLQKKIEMRRAQETNIAMASLAVFIAICGGLVYRQQRMKNSQQRQEYKLQAAIALIESQSRLQEQRLAISRDLHDNIGAQLTFIISAVDSIRHSFEIGNEGLKRKLSHITDFTRATIIELRDTIWAMNNTTVTFEDLKARILNFTEKAKIAAEGIQFSFTIEDSLLDMALSSLKGINIYRAIQEALNNAIKYANAQHIEMALYSNDDDMVIEIKDDGKGFDTEKESSGNGLYNMQKRMEELGGSFTINSREGAGTQIIMRLPKATN